MVNLGSGRLNWLGAESFGFLGDCDLEGYSLGSSCLTTLLSSAEVALDCNSLYLMVARLCFRERRWSGLMSRLI